MKKKHKPLNPSHHIWKRLKGKEDKENLVWKCQKCKVIKTVKRGPGWQHPDRAGCKVLHGQKSETDMKRYPSIDNRIDTSLKIIAFDKIDGSNIRAEWNQKQGFYKFGTRKRIIDENDFHLGKAVTLIRKKYAKDLDQIFRRHKPIQRFQRGAVCFFEFYGPKSFAGQHVENDQHDVVLFDVSPFNAGLLPPDEFVQIFGKLDIPRVLYRGQLTQKFIDSIRNSTLEGMGSEGVVCKARNPSKKKTAQPIMFKIKSDDWIGKLKEMCGDDMRQFERLL
jgi:hypothetical protein